MQSIPSRLGCLIVESCRHYVRLNLSAMDSGKSQPQTSLSLHILVGVSTCLKLLQEYYGIQIGSISPRQTKNTYFSLKPPAALDSAILPMWFFRKFAVKSQSLMSQPATGIWMVWKWYWKYWNISWYSSRRSHHRESSEMYIAWPVINSFAIPGLPWCLQTVESKRLHKETHVLLETLLPCLATTWNTDEHSQAEMQKKSKPGCKHGRE